MNKYVIFTDSCSDLTTEMRKKHHIEYVQMEIIVDGKQYPADLDWKAYSVKEFYDWMRNGKKIKTSLVPIPEFINKFKPWLDEGYDIIYIACSSALSGSVGLSKLASEQLLAGYTNRKIVSIDSLAGSLTEGLIVLKAAELQEAGKSFEEVVDFVEENKLKSNQFATVDTLDYLKATGRIKGTKAFFGNLMGVKPIFISDRLGNNFVVTKAKGKKNAVQMLVDGIVNSIDDVNDTVYVAHGDDLGTAELVKAKLLDLGIKHVEIAVIGPIVGTTCGPGIYATFCWGKKVTIAEGD